MLREAETLTEDVAKRLREKGATDVEPDILEGSAGTTILRVVENLALLKLHFYMRPPLMPLFIVDLPSIPRMLFLMKVDRFIDIPMCQESFGL